MSLTKIGKRLEKSFEKEYGKKKGKQVFFAWERKHPLVLKGHGSLLVKRGR